MMDSFILSSYCYDWSFNYDSLDYCVAFCLISVVFIYNIFYYNCLISNFKCYLYAINYFVYDFFYYAIY